MVTNMPGAVPRTSTYALSNATLPYAIKLADLGFADAVKQDPALARGVNTYKGHITYAAVAEAFATAHTPLDKLL
jgi:alanine dehydrogenase